MWGAIANESIHPREASILAAARTDIIHRRRRRGRARQSRSTSPPPVHRSAARCTEDQLDREDARGKSQNESAERRERARQDPLASPATPKCTLSQVRRASVI